MKRLIAKLPRRPEEVLAIIVLIGFLSYMVIDICHSIGLLATVVSLGIGVVFCTFISWLAVSSNSSNGVKPGTQTGELRIWVDFNDVCRGDTATLLKFSSDPKATVVGAAVIAYDTEGNTCPGVVTGFASDWVNLKLDLPRFCPAQPKADSTEG